MNLWEKNHLLVCDQYLSDCINVEKISEDKNPGKGLLTISYYILLIINYGLFHSSKYE